ncbi:MAG: DNA/RNA helicase domain-containing protein [Bacillota bacterium]|nr:DNA/RNA helicase domain-containing protein [Bacillota bacterium]
MSRIYKTEFNESALEDIKEYKYGKNWPVVYILHGKKEAYVGETTSVVRRTKDHLENSKRKKLDLIHIISDDEFNKSAALDIESKLIEYIAGDGKYKLQNGNRGLRDHNYYEREKYSEKFELIWNELLSMKFANNKIIDIENSDLFKLSPFKVLTDEQVDIVESIENIIKKEEKSNHIIKGEPGSGKTILAVYLVKYLLSSEENKLKNIKLVVPMVSLRNTIKQVFKSIKGLKANMVIGPYDVAKEEFDLLIVDEAHRLARRKNLSNYGAFDKVNKKLGFKKESGNQLDWLFKQSKHVVLLYDKNQSVKPTDITLDRFKGIDANMYSLNSQFRVKAGKEYTKYIENILNNNVKISESFTQYELKVFEDVQDMVNAIKKKDKKYGLSRNIAGYAWKWISKNDKSKFDIDIKGYQYRWNSTSKDWINSEDAINEIGCIHTVQGYDLNFAGVIIGPELAMIDGKIQYIDGKYKDVSAKDSSKTEEGMRTFIVNIYKTLLTRGIYGTFIYICDDNLRKYFSKYIDVVKKQPYFQEIETMKRHMLTEEEIKNKKVISVMSYGDIAAGKLEPVNSEIKKQINVPLSLLENNKEYFMLEVKGTSMIDININPNDYVVVKKQNYANDNDIVIAVVGNDATIKRYTIRKEKIVLMPENKNIKEINVEEDDLVINGIVVGIIKNIE